MFSNGMAEANATEVRLKHLPSAAVKQLVEFAYTSKLSLNSRTVLDIFESANMLQFITAMKFCETFLQEQITVQNCSQFMLYAERFYCMALYAKGRLCAAQNFKEVSMSEDYLRLPVTNMLHLLQESNLDMEYEEHVYEAMMRWLNFDKDERVHCYGDLFHCIRLNFISRWYLDTVIAHDGMLEKCKAAQIRIKQLKKHGEQDGRDYRTSVFSSHDAPHQEVPWQLPPSRKNTGMTEKIIFLQSHSTKGQSELILFDPVNNSWSKTNTPCPLASGAATLECYGDGLLVMGGWSPNRCLGQRGVISTVCEYKVMTIFPTLWYSGEHPTGLARYLHSSIVVGKYLYIIGGLDETQNLQATMYVSDTEQRYRYNVLPRMPAAACRPAVAHFNGNIYVFGGYCKDGSPLNFVQSYDIMRRKWKELPSMLCLNIACQYAVCIDCIIYLFCADIADSERHPRIESSTFGHGQPTKYFDTIKAFDPINGLWTNLYSFNSPRSGEFCLTTLCDKIYITGGLVNGEQNKMIDCYDPVTNKVERVGEALENNLVLCTTMKVMHENFGL